MPLPAKQLLFAAEYQKDLNGTQAAIRAGYSAKTAAQTAYKLLLKPEIAAIVANDTRQRFKRIEVNADFVIQGLARLANANLSECLRIDPKTGRALIDMRNVSPEVLDAVVEVEEEEWVERTGSGRDDFEGVRRVKVKLHDKAGPLTTLGRHLKLWTDRVEVEVEVSDPKERLKQFIAERRQIKG